MTKFYSYNLLQEGIEENKAKLVFLWADRKVDQKNLGCDRRSRKAMKKEKDTSSEKIRKRRWNVFPNLVEKLVIRIKHNKWYFTHNQTRIYKHANY